MAKQMGIIPLKGTIGNITFYQSKAGHLARGKGGLNADRIATDPAFVRTVKTERNLAGPVKPANFFGRRFAQYF